MMLTIDKTQTGPCIECGDEGVHVEYFDGIAAAFFCAQHFRELKKQEALWDKEDASLPDIGSPEDAKMLLEETATELGVSLETLLDPNECFGFLDRSAKLRKVLRYLGDE